MESANVQETARLPSPLPPGERPLDRARVAGDGGDRADPVAGRQRDRRGPGGRPARRAAARPCDRRGGDPAPRIDLLAADRRRQGLARGRVRPALARLRAPAVARARLLRLPADRPADVARDGRPAVDPLLPRLRADLHHPERPDADHRRHGDVRDPARPRLPGAAPGAVRRAHRHALQPLLAAGAPGGAAADRRADRRGGGVGLRRPGRQGIRPRGSHAAAVPRLGLAGLRPERLLDPAACLLQPADRLPAQHRAGGGAPRRRPAGDRRLAPAR